MTPPNINTYLCFPAVILRRLFAAQTSCAIVNQSVIFTAFTLVSVAGSLRTLSRDASAEVSDISGIPVAISLGNRAANWSVIRHGHR